VAITWLELMPSCLTSEKMDPPFSCSACKTVQYCSEACQRADWCRHDKECDEFRDSGFEEEIESCKKSLIEGKDKLDEQLYAAS
jgi:hypothetical protein